MQPNQKRLVFLNTILKVNDIISSIASDLIIIEDIYYSIKAIEGEQKIVKEYIKMNFSMLIINNNRSKAYLQNLVRNNFIPNKVIVLNDSNVTLVEHTENDKLISQNTNQKFIRKIDSLDIFFDEKEHILKH